MIASELELAKTLYHLSTGASGSTDYWQKSLPWSPRWKSAYKFLQGSILGPTFLPIPCDVCVITTSLHQLAGIFFHKSRETEQHRQTVDYKLNALQRRQIEHDMVVQDMNETAEDMNKTG